MEISVRTGYEVCVHRYNATHNKNEVCETAHFSKHSRQHVFDWWSQQLRSVHDDAGSISLSRRHGGGCRGYRSDVLERSMTMNHVACGNIHDNMSLFWAGMTETPYLRDHHRGRLITIRRHRLTRRKKCGNSRSWYQKHDRCKLHEISRVNRVVERVGKTALRPLYVFVHRGPEGEKQLLKIRVKFHGKRGPLYVEGRNYKHQWAYG